MSVSGANLRTISVFGATGRQGRGVVDGLLTRGRFNVRAIVHNKNSDKARQLITDAAATNNSNRLTVVEGDYQKLSVDEISEVLQGSYGVFAVTNYWKLEEKGLNREQIEFKLGKKIADATKKANVEFMIYSGQEAVEEKMKFSCPPFDSKAKVEKYLKDEGITFASTRFSFYYDNFKDYLFLGVKEEPADSGKYVWEFAIDEQKPLPLVNAHDAGLLIADMFDNKSKYKNQIVDLVSEMLTPAQMIECFTAETGKPCVYSRITDWPAFVDANRIRGFKDEFLPETQSMMRFYDEQDLSKHPDQMALLHEAVPTSARTTFRSWMKKFPDWYKNFSLNH